MKKGTTGAFLVGTGLGAILFFGWLWAVLFVIIGVVLIGGSYA